MPATPSDAPPLEAFLEGLKVAWRSTEDVRPTAQPKPSKQRYRTVPDPLEAATDALKAWFDADPSLTGRQLLDRLQEEDPGAYPDGLIRTVQRRLKVWRRNRAKALVISASETGNASEELSAEALRWLRAPRLAGNLSAPENPQARTVVAAGTSQ